MNPNRTLKLKSRFGTPDLAAVESAVVGDRKAEVGSADYLFHLLAVISRRRDCELDHLLQGLKLNIGRYRALATIDVFGPCTMTAFANLSPLDRTTNTRTVDHLVRSGWVSRSKDADDRRQIYIALTEAGVDLYHRARDIISAHNSKLIEGISDELQAQIIAAELMLARKLEPRGGQFVDRENASETSLSTAAMIS